MSNGSGWIVFLLGVTLCGAGTAHGDTVTITYSSGKMQRVTLDERLDQVADVTFHKASATSGAKGEDAAGMESGTGPAATNAKAAPGKEPGAAIHWAPPVEE